MCFYKQDVQHRARLLIKCRDCAAAGSTVCHRLDINILATDLANKADLAD